MTELTHRNSTRWRHRRVLIDVKPAPGWFTYYRDDDGTVIQEPAFIGIYVENCFDETTRIDKPGQPPLSEREREVGWYSIDSRGFGNWADKAVNYLGTIPSDTWDGEQRDGERIDG